ncbi:BREX-2 system adenine-specific DNA-methyltransferase PglX [Glycomyces salinus]|uniref:BREX-2 system adenine-specific DNA-methyltransferase PglX n=1 Tax=Glycomyces salinus TaxID=980294 RepID=UPI0018EDE681|nr:BREX-2 system adenine-specific DNA-methyltransferase PglX [Glycomyces salinus]
MNRELLLADLKKQVAALEDDLRERAAEPEFDRGLRDDYDAATTAGRTATAYEVWLEGQITQAAVAWVLGTVFLRFVEDNKLIELPYLTGPGEWGDVAVDRQQEHFGKRPLDTDRHWIEAGFADMRAASPVAAGLFDKAHNPMHRITPSGQAARTLVEFWRRKGEDGKIVHDFTDETWDTRFLGDLYQDLSEAARKTYALLQTPDFVEEFILDLTLTPALDEFGLEPDYPLKNDRPDFEGRDRKGLRLIDPTCGSGHFLLGAFHRLLEQWEEHAPGLDRWELIRRTLYSVHGVDKNPFAVAIARFRLLVAALKAAGETSLKGVEFQINVAVGDSLLHGRGANQVQRSLLDGDDAHAYVTEDIYEDKFRQVDLLGIGSYHVVVGNPPYITVKDKQENENYRKAYPEVCKGKYALSVPFAQRFFQLGVNGHHTRTGAGYIGQITANSFMKREFGSKLIEDYFNRKVDLTHVIDTSGAYIPGHGTPTVILIGRRSAQRGHDVRVVQGIQGEPSQPVTPEKGLVWNAITEQVENPGSESQWVSCADLPRERLTRHPWNLAGGGADALILRIEDAANSVLGARVKRIGFYGVIGADDVSIASARVFERTRTESEYHRRLVVGDQVRDWDVLEGLDVFHPYTSSRQLVSLEDLPGHKIRLWPYRTTMGNRSTFSKGTYFSDGRPWYEWHQLPVDKGAHRSSIVYGEIATHNHFILDQGDSVFNRTAPIIKLRDGSTYEDHLELIGVLNSSTAAFCLRQRCFPKGGDKVGGDGARVTGEHWEERYAFNSTNVEQVPLPKILPLELGRYLDSVSQKYMDTQPDVVIENLPISRDALDNAHSSNTTFRLRMIALQEELDWQVYGFYGLFDDSEMGNLTGDPDSVPEVDLGERAFEIVLARKMNAGEIKTQWFKRHDSIPITEIPSRWPAEYRELVQRRIDCIESRRDIALIERPEHKRRWSTIPWEKREQEALRTWLLDACERREFWYAEDHNGIEQPEPQTINRLADRLRTDPDVMQVAELYAGQGTDLAKVLTDIIKTEHVPYLSAMRYKDSGMRKREQWEWTWEEQHKEDETGEDRKIPVPPKYSSGDFRKNEYWRQRGKLDVPNERFISYPEASPESDDSLLLGWAGWNHREQAHALTILVLTRSQDDNWGPDKLTPLLAGLDEQQLWLRQWHSEEDPNTGESPAQTYTGFLNDMMGELELNRDDLKGWRPAPKTGRKSKKQ